MDQPSLRTPRTEPMGADGPDGRRPRSSRTSFYVSIGCVAVILGLVLGVGGFFGVRAVTGGDPTQSATTDPGGTGESLESAPAGKGAAVPLGTSFPVVSPDEYVGEVQVAVTEMDWDATAEVAEANEYNDAPGAGEKYMTTTLEATFHGEGTLSTTFWVSVTYVAEDGTEYGDSYAITPLDTQLPWEVADGTSFSQQTAFLIPEDAPEGGHIVLTPTSGADLATGTWVTAA
ncbi:hypothetical protein [Brachybacterium tyrofermentans]|uniref:hypothetical protein n=1 Tax=Brachybacterium tyrofermentans TaxID=47848 RepID=UPI003FD04E6B